MAWPPKSGERLPGAEAVVGVRSKLIGYSLNVSHRGGRAKAHGFKSILGITADDVGYLARVIQLGVTDAPIAEVRPNPPHGINCAVDLPIRGVHGKSGRTVAVRTVWEIAEPGANPRLVSAFPRP